MLMETLERESLANRKKKPQKPTQLQAAKQKPKTKAHLGSEINNLPSVLFGLQCIAWNKKNITALPYSSSPSQSVTPSSFT